MGYALLFKIPSRKGTAEAKSQVLQRARSLGTQFRVLFNKADQVNLIWQTDADPKFEKAIRPAERFLCILFCPVEYSVHTLD